MNEPVQWKVQQQSVGPLRSSGRATVGASCGTTGGHWTGNILNHIQTKQLNVYN